MVQENKETLEELTAKIYTYPIGSDAYKVAKSNIEDMLSSSHEKYSKFLVCIPSKLHAEFSSLSEENTDMFSMNIMGYINSLEFMNNKNDIILFENEEQVSNLFSEVSVFPSNPIFKYIPRYEAEYNLHYRQLVVCSYITDGKNVILLHSLKGQTRIDDRITMIQGHVEFDPDIYLMSQTDYLRKHAMLEFEEEIKITSETIIEFPKLPSWYIGLKDNHDALEHIGVVYIIPVQDATELFNSIESGEPQKHEIVLLSLADRHTYMDNLDDWIKPIIERLAEGMGV